MFNSFSAYKAYISAKEYAIEEVASHYVDFEDPVAAVKQLIAEEGFETIESNAEIFAELSNFIYKGGLYGLD